MILLISVRYVHDLVPNHLAEGWKAEVSKGGFVPCSTGKRESSEMPEHVEDESVDEEAEGDGEGMVVAAVMS